ENMVFGGGVDGENVNCFAGLDRVAREGGIRHDADEAGLSEGTRRPAFRPMTSEPPQRQGMLLMAGPKKSDEQIGVEQVTLHAPSVSIRRTSSVVTFGESSGRWKTTSPPLSWAGVVALSPRRKRSDTVLPSETPRSLA